MHTHAHEMIKLISINGFGSCVLTNYPKSFKGDEQAAIGQSSGLRNKCAKGAFRPNDEKYRLIDEDLCELYILFVMIAIF